VFYFVEGEEGAFNIKVVYTEKSNKYLCFSGRPLEAQIAEFTITAIKLREMRRTLNSRAVTTFEDFTFNVFNLIRLIQRLIGFNVS
jgi:hypothetical protein